LCDYRFNSICNLRTNLSAQAAPKFNYSKIMTNKPEKLTCFKAYDIRGKVPGELDEDLSYRIGQAYAAHFHPKKIVIGHDIRLSGQSLSKALCDGFLHAGVDIVDIGLCGTEEIYFAAANLPVDGGIIITASHNPADYNGMKLVRRGARPISGDTGLKEIERLAIQGHKVESATKGSYALADPRPAYIDHLLTYIDPKKLKPLTIVANCGNGCAGPVLDLLAEKLPCKFIKLQPEPDGSFPNGVPNPLLPENRAATSEAVLAHNADLGIAWDGDFDRCFLFDEQGRFLEGYYIVGLLAQAMLQQHPGAKIIHDPRLTWNTVELVKEAGGTPVMSKTGHAFIKERMRQEDAVYGGEMSAHHYFKDFSYCDSGMIPWLLIANIISKSGKPLSALVEERMAAYPVSGEINSTVNDPDTIIKEIESQFGGSGRKDYTDGLSVEFDKYRFNLRKSNTEPLIRLNVESRGDEQLMCTKTAELLDCINK
jgi:phosphomannomutase/phosphomannomutase/phosphoglucomutase